jgi:two-component system, NtrC family, sensor kinase
MSGASGQTLANATAVPAVQARHSGAGWPALRSLRWKLIAAAAGWVAVVIGVLTIAALGIAERRLEQDLRDTARLTALGVADDIELRIEPLGDPALGVALHDFLIAAPQVRDIALYEVTAQGLRYAQGTSSVPSTIDPLAEEAIRSARAVGADRPAHLTAIATPILRDGRPVGAVRVTVSLGPVATLRTEGRIFALAIAVVAVLGITILIHLLTYRLVHAPLDDVLQVVARARAGDLSARVPVVRTDEIGDVAAGINNLLTEIESLQTHLRHRVEAATRELRDRNEQLVRSYASVLALRGELARARELATVGQTMANVAHQIGTPLNLVSAHVQLLQKELSEDPAATRRLGIVVEQVDKVTDIVRELLDRARPQSAPAAFALMPLLMRLTHSVQVFAPGSVRVSLETAGSDLPAVFGDETQIELALMNLITNALDAMPDGGELTITAAAHDRGVRVDVCDTGVGIPAAVAGRVFEPWVTSKPGRGTGLGLSITREVVQRAGGTIELIPSSGPGTTFRVYLPAAKTE